MDKHNLYAFQPPDFEHALPFGLWIFSILFDCLHFMKFISDGVIKFSPLPYLFYVWVMIWWFLTDLRRWCNRFPGCLLFSMYFLRQWSLFLYLQEKQGAKINGLPFFIKLRLEIILTNSSMVWCRSNKNMIQIWYAILDVSSFESAWCWWLVIMWYAFFWSYYYYISLCTIINARPYELYKVLYFSSWRTVRWCD